MTQQEIDRKLDEASGVSYEIADIAVQALAERGYAITGNDGLSIADRVYDILSEIVLRQS